MLKLLSLILMLAAGASGFFYYIVTPPLKVDDYAHRTNPLCKAVLQVVYNVSPVSANETANNTCDCLVRESTKIFGAQRTAEMFEVIRIGISDQMAGNGRVGTNAQQEMMHRLFDNPDIRRRCSQ